MSIETQTTMVTTRDENALGEQFYLICNLEGITLIWYDANMNVIIRKKLKVTPKYLRQINNFVIFEKEEQSCINTIKSIKNEKILLVTSGSAADRILSLDGKSIHKLVHSVFIFCREKDKYQTLSKKYSKINGIFTDPEELKTAIKNEVDLIQRHFEIFNIYDTNEQKSIYDVSQQQVSFFWLPVFKETVVRMAKDKKAKSEMIDTCTKYYHGNKYELERIKDFNQGYKPEHAIRWYTETSFVYKLVNKALRIADVEQLYIFRFYISDLCEEIEKRYKQITEQRSWLFYRGVRLPLEEVEKLKRSEGKLISTNGFLSTSFSKEVAIRFALTKTPKDTEEYVLFEIECGNESATFAFIGKDSVHPEEKEVLFDLGTSFKVLSVTDSREEEAKINIWIVKLRSTQEGKIMVQDFANSFTKTLDDGYQSHAEVYWGHLLHLMGESEKSLRYFQKLINARPENVPVEIIHWEMSFPLIDLKKFDEALEHLELCRKRFQTYGTGLINFYSILSHVYRRKRQYIRAIDESKKALLVSIMQMGEYHSHTANQHFELGLTWLGVGQYQFALYNFSKAVEIYEKYPHAECSCPLGKAFESIADVYRMKGERHRAVEYYQKAADIYGSTAKIHLPVMFRLGLIFYKMGLILCHSSTIDLSLQCFHYALTTKQAIVRDILVVGNMIESFSVIGKVHIVKGEFEISLEFFENALSQSLQKYGLNDADAADLYYDKGIALECLGRNDEALTAFETALDIRKKLFPEGHRDLACSLSSTGNQYRIKKEFSLAKEYCYEAMAMQKRILPPDDFETCLPLYHIGLILYDQQDYKESLSNLWTALKIEKRYMKKMSYILQGLTLTTIGDINRRLENICLALQCFKDALSCYEIFFSHEHLMILELRSKIKALEEESQTS